MTQAGTGTSTGELVYPVEDYRQDADIHWYKQTPPRTCATPGDEIARNGLKETVVYNSENAGDVAERLCGPVVVQ